MFACKNALQFVIDMIYKLPRLLDSVNIVEKLRKVSINR